MRAFEHAARRFHLLLQRFELGFVDEHRRSPASLKSACAAQKVAELMRVVALGRHIGEGGGQQRAADAIADDVGIAHAGGLLHRVQRGEDAVAHVVLEGLLREAAVGIDPGRHEHGVALADQPADEAILGPQIEDVEFVDPGREDQQRPLIDLLRRRIVLQQFDHLVAEHHLAGRGGDILADLEGVGRLADGKLALAALDIVEQIVQTLDQILAVRLQRGAQHFGIGEEEIGGRDRVGELLGIEFDALARLVVEAVELGDRVLHPVGGQQIGLLDEVEDLVFLPVLVAEAPVAGRGRDDGRPRRPASGARWIPTGPCNRATAGTGPRRSRRVGRHAP